ncbi:FAD-dependent oxidoreductase [uncultured Maritalea sp.]|jgi:pyruvate/2-oxoglutarate dehydrogenase complex dihydrolipoamide dehydrogenase (E3) component|uniref:dihydrolipoyl dehydrogenase family protein n=1 Tax=uncultured Maritalea sp. TaxID=757249 RepID=UPI00261B0914|nr:FAD-dependent oxidoreductase [uncultured Maritalea sp.]
MAEFLKPDLCVIGAGSGGLTVAAAAAQLGATVILIERDKMGGDCLNTGCVPSKALIAAAKRAQLMRTAPEFGIQAEEPKPNFGRINDHIKEVIAGIAPNDSIERFRGLGVNVIEGEASFVDKRTVKVGNEQIRARRFVIATGSRPMVPPIPGLAETPFLTNESIFEQRRKPSELIIIGGGPIGMELAQAHQRLGCNVTVLEMADPLAKDDRELTDIALRHIRREGVDIRSNTKVVEVKKKARAIAVDVEGLDGQIETLVGTHLLVAAGRSPNVERLNLDAAMVAHTNKGITINEGLKTSNRRIYAIGDVASGLQFTHVAGYQAGLVVRNALFGLPVRQNRQIIPWATYTDPAISQVGMNEEEARQKFGDKFRVLRWSFDENDRARAERQTDGLVKVLTNNSGKILGAGAVGLHADELINMYAFAIANGMKIGAFTKMVSPYPTLFEVAKRISIEFYKDKLDNPLLKGLIALNRLFG